MRFYGTGTPSVTFCGLNKLHETNCNIKSIKIYIKSSMHYNILHFTFNRKMKSELHFNIRNVNSAVYFVHKFLNQNHECSDRCFPFHAHIERGKALLILWITESSCIVHLAFHKKYILTTKCSSLEWNMYFVHTSAFCIQNVFVHFISWLSM